MFGSVPSQSGPGSAASWLRVRVTTVPVYLYFVDASGLRRLRFIYAALDRTGGRGVAPRRGSRISAKGGRQGIDDLIWDGDERFLTYLNTDSQLFKMFIAILCLNGVEQPFKGHQCPFFLPLRRRNTRLRRGSLRPRGGRQTQRPPPLDPRPMALWGFSQIPKKRRRYSPPGFGYLMG